MNIPIYEGLPYHDRFGTPIYPDFRNMLRVESILKDESIGNTEKTFACLSLLYGSIPKNLDVAFNELLWFLFCGEEPRKAGKGSQIHRYMIILKMLRIFLQGFFRLMGSIFRIKIHIFIGGLLWRFLLLCRKTPR